MLGSPCSPHTVLTRKKSTYIYTHTLVNTLHIVCKNTYNIQHMFQHRSLLHRISDGERASLRSSPWRTLLDERCSTESYWIYNSAWQNTLQTKRLWKRKALYLLEDEGVCVLAVKEPQGVRWSLMVESTSRSIFLRILYENRGWGGLDQAVFSRQIWFKS